MEDVLYHIPVLSHVKKFLAHRCETEPFVVTTHNVYGVLLFMCLERKPKPEKPLILNDRLEIRIPKFNADTQGFYITNKKIELFNKAIERMMLNELMSVLDEVCKDRKKGEIKRIIFEFRERYDIYDHELEYQNLRKAYTRHRFAATELPAKKKKLVA